MSVGAAQSSAQNMRRAPRDEVYLRTLIRKRGGAFVDAHLVNISPFGFMVRTEARFADDQIIDLRLPTAGDAEAKVVWALGGRVGGAFSRPFSDRDYAALLGAIGTSQSGWQLG